MNYHNIPELLIALMAVLLIIYGVLLSIQQRIINMYQKQLKDNYKQSNEVLNYCIRRILKDSIDSEDYETAKRCQDILEEFKKETVNEP